MSSFLPSTKYINVTRTVIGTASVEDSDLVLDCDTTSAAVIVNLKKIPENHWSTLYKLYIKDSGNNASVNNITITAPTGFKINGNSTLVLSSNGVCALIRISSDTDYIATVSSTLSALSVLDTSTVDLTLAGSVLSASVKYSTVMVLNKTFSNAAVIYLPKIPIYSAAGVINTNYYADPAYAASLGTVNSIKSYDTITPLGQFTAGSLNNTTGVLTIPSSGYYLFTARLRLANFGAGSNVGASSLLSGNTPTSGLKWANNTFASNANMIMFLNDVAYNGQVTVTRNLVDVGSFDLNIFSNIRTYQAGNVVNLGVINNSEMDVYGSATSGAIDFYAIKISEL